MTAVSSTHLVILPREKVAALCRRFYERHTMAASHRAAREFGSYYELLRGLLVGRQTPTVTLRQSLEWYRNAAKLSGDTEFAFECGRQVQGGGD